MRVFGAKSVFPDACWARGRRAGRKNSRVGQKIPGMHFWGSGRVSPGMGRRARGCDSGHIGERFWRLKREAAIGKMVYGCEHCGATAKPEPRPSRVRRRRQGASEASAGRPEPAAEAREAAEGRLPPQAATRPGDGARATPGARAAGSEHGGTRAGQARRGPAPRPNEAAEPMRGRPVGPTDEEERSDDFRPNEGAA